MNQQNTADELEQMIDQAWTDLVDKDDRTSPEEHQDMALITAEELREFMGRVAALRAAGSAEPVAYRWRPHGATVWIYDPEMSWFDAHRAEIDHEPLYTHPAPAESARRDEIVAGGFYKTRGDKHNLPHIVGPLEHDKKDGNAAWKARVHDQTWKWGYDGLANADGAPHNRDLIERVYAPTPPPQAAESVRKALAAVTIFRVEEQEQSVCIAICGTALHSFPVDQPVGRTLLRFEALQRAALSRAPQAAEKAAETVDTVETVAAEIAYFEAHADRFAAAHKDLTAAPAPFISNHIIEDARASPIMQAASRAAETVAGWSDAKRDYAARAMGDVPAGKVVNDKLFDLYLSSATPHEAAAWTVFGDGFGLRCFSTKGEAIKEAHAWFGIAKFTLRLWPDRTELHLVAAPDANPEDILTRAIEAFKAELASLKGCPVHQAAEPEPQSLHGQIMAMPTREEIAKIVLRAMANKADSNDYGLSHALKINTQRSDKAADAILALSKPRGRTREA